MWLLEDSIRQALEQAQAAGVMPTVQQQATYQAQHISALGQTGSRILTTAGTTAQIEVNGVLTKSPSFLALLFGGGNTTFAEIISALAQADQDENITDAVLAIDSPGGSVDGLFDTLAAIDNFSKPIRAFVSNMAASAAFALAAQADRIDAANGATRFGSVGILASFEVSEDVIRIASTKAPKKNPDITTKEGVATVREELDALHDVFVDSIAKGRDITTKKVNVEFGQGAMVLAGEALKRGMIDSVASVSSSPVAITKTTTAVGGNQPKAKIMDLTILKAQHADVYQSAAREGADRERDRVIAHLTMGEASGDLKTAYSAIKDGTEMTATLQATYLSASMNKSDVADRDKDDNNANAGDGATGGDTPDAHEEVTALVETQLGMKG